MEITELLALYQKNNITLELVNELKSGKDADLFLVRNTTEPSNTQTQVLKIYKQIADVSLNRFNPYLSGRKFSGNYGKVLQTSSKRGKKFLANLRVKREFNQLTKLKKQTNLIPGPIFTLENTILMEFIGQNDIPAKRLDELNFKHIESKIALNQIIEFIGIMLNFHLVHSDLSPFNILYHNEQIYIIDFPQVVDIKTNPDWAIFYERDTNNVLKYFEKTLETQEITQARKKLESLFKSAKDKMVYR